MIPRPVVFPTVIGTVITDPEPPLTLGSETVTGGVPDPVGEGELATVEVLVGVEVAVAVAVAVLVGVGVPDPVGEGVGDPPANEQVKSPDSNISDHPPSIEPTFVAVSSTINKFHVPFIAVPFEPKAEARVAEPPGAASRYGGAGAGATKASCPASAVGSEFARDYRRTNARSRRVGQCQIDAGNCVGSALI